MSRGRICYTKKPPRLNPLLSEAVFSIPPRDRVLSDDESLNPLLSEAVFSIRRPVPTAVISSAS